MSDADAAEVPAELPPALRDRLTRCREILRQLRRVAVAFSGGVDSTLLLALAAETLGAENVLAVLGVGPIFPTWEVEEARALARRLGVRLAEVQAGQMDNPDFTANPAQRCYICKKQMFTQLSAEAKEEGFDVVASGANAADTSDYRPGMKAEEELGVARPLLEAGLTKADIRAASRAMGLPTWDKPTYACLATRVPYGSRITTEALSRIERAERILHGLGFGACRVRDHGSVARVEVPSENLAEAVAARDKIVGPLKALGYTYVTLDLQGFRSGSMNEALPPARRPGGSDESGKDNC